MRLARLRYESMNAHCEQFFLCCLFVQRARKEVEGKKSWRFLLLLDSRIFLCHSSPLLCVFWSANVCSLARRRRPTHKTLPPLAVVARVLQSSGFNGTLCETTEECSASVDCVATTIDKRRARSHATTNERGAWIVAKFCILVMWTHGSTQKRQKKTTTTNQRESEWLWISRVGQHLFNFNECREKIAESHFYETSWR